MTAWSPCFCVVYRFIGQDGPRFEQLEGVRRCGCGRDLIDRHNHLDGYACHGGPEEVQREGR